MKAKLLYPVWGAMAVLCIGLGTLEAENLWMQLAQLAIGLMFFVPGGLILYNAFSQGSRKGVLAIRWISGLSLALTLVNLVAFFITAGRGDAAADWLYELLILVSCPMICCQYWVVSLFLWACLFGASFLKKDRK